MKIIIIALLIFIFLLSPCQSEEEPPIFYGQTHMVKLSKQYGEGHCFWLHRELYFKPFGKSRIVCIARKKPLKKEPVKPPPPIKIKK